MVFYGIGGSSVAYNGSIVRARSFEPWNLTLKNEYVKPVSANIYDRDGVVASSVIVQAAESSSLTVPFNGYVKYDVQKSANFERCVADGAGPGQSSWCGDTYTGWSGLIKVSNGGYGYERIVNAAQKGIPVFTGINSVWRLNPPLANTAIHYRLNNGIKVQPQSSSNTALSAYRQRNSYFMHNQDMVPDYKTYPINQWALSGSTASAHLQMSVSKTGIYGWIRALIQSSTYGAGYYSEHSYQLFDVGGWTGNGTSIGGASGDFDKMMSSYMSAGGGATYPLDNSSMITRYALSADLYDDWREVSSFSSYISFNPVEWTLIAGKIK